MIREATQKDVPQIKSVLDSGIGENFYTEAELSGFIDNKDSSVILVYTDDEDTPRGFIYSFTSPLREAMEVLSIPEDTPEFSGMDRSETVGVMKTTSTDPEYRKEGICIHLVEETKKYMRSKGVKRVYVSALTSPDGYVMAGGLLEASGYKPMCRLDKPWINIDCYCPTCKSRFCRCDSVIYAWNTAE